MAVRRFRLLQIVPTLAPSNRSTRPRVPHRRLAQARKAYRKDLRTPALGTSRLRRRWRPSIRRP